MSGKLSFLFLDNSDEKSGMGLNTPDITILNIEAYTSGVPANLYDRTEQAILGLTGGTQQRVTLVAESVLHNEVAPVDPNMQRERKAVVTFRDTVTNILGSVEIPIFNMNGVQDGTDDLDLTTAEWVEFISVLEEGYVSNIGNPIVVVSAKHVGRNS